MAFYWDRYDLREKKGEIGEMVQSSEQPHHGRFKVVMI